MKRVLGSVLLLLVCAVLFSCSGDIKLDRRLAADAPGLKVSVELHTMEYHDEGGSVSTYIKGKLYLKNLSGDKIHVYLQNARLMAEGKAGKIHGDSDALLFKMAFDFDLPGGSTRTADVYWEFKGRLSPDSSEKFSLVYE